MYFASKRTWFTMSSFLTSALLIVSCGRYAPTSSNPGPLSTATGLEYNLDGGFQVTEFFDQPNGPNLVFIEGGRTVMGSFEEDVVFSRDNIERVVTLPSFYMDETEVANIHWLEYEYYIKQDSSEEFWRTNLPDTTVWVRNLAFNDPYVSHYYRYPGFRFFPVVGINWIQANNYCKWRTEIINYKIAQEVGMEDDEFDFDGSPREKMEYPIESGYFFPDYRLPTEAEWEYAAKALFGTQYMNERQTHQRIYPWDGHLQRYPYVGKSQGTFMANFKRNMGDYAGIAGKLNDGAMITTSVYDYLPNDYGLYNMAGNVNEWVLDVYRQGSFQEMEDFNPIRKDGYGDPSANYDGGYNYIGREAAYTKEEAIAAGLSANAYDEEHPPVKRMRVYKGGSWQDVAYWLAPGNRRARFEDEASDAIGFRCAMVRVGLNY